MKIRKSFADRFKITKSGKVLHRSGFSRHLKSAKGKSQKRRLMSTKELEDKLARKIKKILGR